MAANKKDTEYEQMHNTHGTAPDGSLDPGAADHPHQRCRPLRPANTVLCPHATVALSCHKSGKRIISLHRLCGRPFTLGLPLLLCAQGDSSVPLEEMHKIRKSITFCYIKEPV